MANPTMTLDDLRSQLTGLDAYQPEDEATLRQRAVDIYSPQYQSDLAKLRDQIEFQVDRQQRNAVKTGMQRSSYNAAQQASIRRGGLQSQADLAANYEGNIANMLYNMLEKEKDRQMTADQYRNELLLKLYDMQPSGGGGGGGINKAQIKDALDNLMNRFKSVAARGDVGKSAVTASSQHGKQPNHAYCTAYIQFIQRQ